MATHLNEQINLHNTNAPAVYSKPKPLVGSTEGHNSGQVPVTITFPMAVLNPVPVTPDDDDDEPYTEEYTYSDFQDEWNAYLHAEAIREKEKEDAEKKKAGFIKKTHLVWCSLGGAFKHEEYYEKKK